MWIIRDIFHFAAIVGGRSKIDGDPMLVAQDLSIDAEMLVRMPQQASALHVSQQQRGLSDRSPDRETH